MVLGGYDCFLVVRGFRRAEIESLPAVRPGQGYGEGGGCGVCVPPNALMVRTSNEDGPLVRAIFLVMLAWNRRGIP